MAVLSKMTVLFRTIRLIKDLSHPTAPAAVVIHRLRYFLFECFFLFGHVLLQRSIGRAAVMWGTLRRKLSEGVKPTRCVKRHKIRPESKKLMEKV